VRVRDVELAFERRGERRDGRPPVLLIPPAATRSAVWHTHQVPALCDAGYEVVTYDQRGTAPSGMSGPFRLADLVADAARLIGALGLGSCLVAGSSLGALVAQELAIVRPDLVRGIALLGTRGRLTRFLEAFTRNTVEELRTDGRTSPRRDALYSALQLFAPETLTDDRFATDWLDLAEAFPVRGAGAAAQYESAITPNRLDALGAITAPTLVMSFGLDAIMPPSLVREVADAIPGSRYVEVPGAGHFGFLERPAVVNRALLEFFASADVPAIA
jgi:pimeloyl-ACP methyl ester carboxylesterase